MEHYTPTLGARETGRNARRFVEENNDELWKIFKPLIPFIAGLYLFDAVITDLFFAGSKHGFGLGGILASYFYTCLVISWHRVVINGPDQYVPMNPFKPKKHELVFLGAGILIGVLVFLSIVMVGILAALLRSPAVAILIIPVMIAAIYVAYRVMFYFPAKAVNADITFRDAYGMTKGYLWKLICASFLATIRVMFMAMLYVIVLAIAFGVVLSIVGMGATGMSTLGFIASLPIFLYIQPLATVLGVTVLSNYYLYAIQNPRRRAL